MDGGIPFSTATRRSRGNMAYVDEYMGEGRNNEHRHLSHVSHSRPSGYDIMTTMGKLVLGGRLRSEHH